LGWRRKRKTCHGQKKSQGDPIGDFCLHYSTSFLFLIFQEPV
jgi:hypothetical protein